MSAAERFQLETWVDIIKHCQRPKPAAGKLNDGSQIRQPELAALMSTSKLCNRLAANLLYPIVITDNMAHFTYNRGKPASASGIESKDELMLRIKHLHLEFTNKTFHFGGYEYLINAGDWRPVGDDGIWKENYEASLAIAEREDTYKHTYHIHSNRKVGKESNLANLQTLSIGAFLGSQDDLSARIWKGRAHLSKESAEANSMFTTIWHDAGINRLCHHAVLGPYSMWAISGAPNGRKMPVVTFHLDDEPRGEIPIVMGGGTTRWCMMMKKGKVMQTWDHFWLLVLQSARKKVYERYRLFLGPPPPSAAKPNGERPENHTFNVEIYLPTPAPISKTFDIPWESEHEKKIWRLSASRLESALKSSIQDMVTTNGLAVEGWGEDQWIVKPIFDAPEYVSCGWKCERHNGEEDEDQDWK